MAAALLGVPAAKTSLSNKGSIIKIEDFTILAEEWLYRTHTHTYTYTHTDGIKLSNLPKMRSGFVCGTSTMLDFTIRIYRH